MFITGDLGFGVIENFVEQHAHQFLNVGVAEQNMTAVAAGLATCGRVVFTYSIGNFPTLRCVEQIRNDICYHGLDVKIVTVGGGFSYGSLGYSHHALEDIAVMRALPNMTVVAPGDPIEAAAATKALFEAPGPAYLRLGRAGEQTIHQAGIPFRLGRAITVREGGDVTLVSTGAMLGATLEVAEKLGAAGIHASVISMHTVKPLDEEVLMACAAKTGLLVTIEEHSLIGGLGSAVAEMLADRELSGVRLKRIGIPSTCTYEVGNQEYLRNRFGLSASAMTERVSEFCSSRPIGDDGASPYRRRLA